MLVAPCQRWRLSLPACGSPRSRAGLGLSAASWMRGAERGARLGPAPQAFGSRVPSCASGRTWQLGGGPAALAAALPWQQLRKSLQGGFAQGGEGSAVQGQPVSPGCSATPLGGWRG